MDPTERRRLWSMLRCLPRAAIASLLVRVEKAPPPLPPLPPPPHLPPPPPNTPGCLLLWGMAPARWEVHPGSAGRRACSATCSATWGLAAPAPALRRSFAKRGRRGGKRLRWWGTRPAPLSHRVYVARQACYCLSPFLLFCATLPRGWRGGFPQGFRAFFVQSQSPILCTPSSSSPFLSPSLSFSPITPLPPLTLSSLLLLLLLLLLILFRTDMPRRRRPECGAGASVALDQ